MNEESSFENALELNSSVSKIATVCGLVLVVFIGFLIAATLIFGSKESESRLLGKQAPTIAGVSLDGNEVSNSDPGTWQVVNFFALWCPGCIAEHPELVKFSNWAEENNKAEIVAVVFDSPNLSGIQEFFNSNGGDWPVLDNPSIASDFGVGKIPETFLVSPDGVVARRIQGEVVAADLIEFIESYSDDKIS